MFKKLTAKNLALLLGLLFILILGYLFYENENLPAKNRLPIRGPSGPPLVKGPTGSPPTVVFNPFSDLPGNSETVHFNVKVLESGFVPSNIHVKKGKSLEIVFEADKSFLSSNMGIKSRYFDISGFKPGDKKTASILYPFTSFPFSLLGVDGSEKGKGSVSVE